MVTLWVCLNCDRRQERVHTAEAEGRAWFKTLKTRLKGHAGVTVKSTNCLGGCECNGRAGADNGCCAVGLGGAGKYGYVLNKFAPERDEARLMALLERYMRFKDGRLRCRDEPELLPHIATRLPCAD